jgi:hypothetical protein
MSKTPRRAGAEAEEQAERSAEHGEAPAAVTADRGYGEARIETELRALRAKP